MEEDEKYIPYNIFEKIIKEHTFWPKFIDISDNLYTEILFSDGEITFINGDKFKGKMINSMMSEEGEYYYNNGIVYKGNFKNNKLNGKGKLIYDENSYYDGNFIEGKKNGFGILELKNDNIKYEGNFKDDEFNGEGKLIYSDGSIYNGIFKNGMRDGLGIFKYKSGNYYEGHFKENIKEGFGKMVWEKNKEYLFGNFKNDLPNGFGRYIWKSDSKIPFNRYEGDFVNGKREGIGCFYYSNGNTYIGEWKENYKDGFCIFINEDGKKKYLIFKRNKLIKELTNENKNIELELNNETNRSRKITKNKNKNIIQNNPYENCLYLEDILKNSKKKIIFDIILRFNHTLISIYKENNQNKKLECGSYFSIKYFWNILFKYRLINSYLTITNLNRLLMKKKNNFYIISTNHYYNKIKIDYYKNLLNNNNIEDLIDKFDDESFDNLNFKYILMKNNNELNFYHNSNNILLLRHFIQNIIYCIKLKAYSAIKKRFNNIQNNFNKNWLYLNENFEFVLKEILQHIQDIRSEEKIPKPNFPDEDLILSKSKPTLDLYKDQFKKLYEILISYQKNNNKLKKFNPNKNSFKINSYFGLNELNTKNKNYKELLTKDYQFLLLKEVYKFINKLNYFEYKVEEFNKKNILINQNTIQMDRLVLFFKCFERNHDPEENYLFYYNISKKWNRINNLFKDLMNKMFIRKLNYELTFKEFKDNLYLFLVKHNNLVTKDKRFKQKIEKILSLFFEEVLQTELNIIKKKEKRVFPFSQKDKDLKNIVEIKKRKKEKRLKEKKEMEEKNKENLENIRMKNNDYNCLLIKNYYDEITEESEEIYEDLGDSVYIIKNNKKNK